MSIKNVKVGETCLLPVTVTAIKNCGWLEVTTCDDFKYSLAPSEVNTLSPDPHPKYDPCRKFRAGDKVRIVREYRGRFPKIIERSYFHPDKVYTVFTNEGDNGGVLIQDDDSHQHGFHFWELELITPVEELEPYFVGESENSYDLFRKTSNGNQLRSSFWWKHDPTPDLIELSKANAKAAAEDERDRLNAEWRKEREND